MYSGVAESVPEFPCRRARAVVRYSGTGKVSGKPLDVEVVHVWDVRDGKLARFRQFIDTVTFGEAVPAEAATVT
jgi:ketosteroid isomerase-like protein